MEKYHDQFFEYLNKLSPDQKPVFGKMSPQHMVEHLADLYLIAIGKVPSSVMIPEEEIPKRMAFLMSDEPFEKNLRVPTLPENPSPLRFPDIETAIEKLRAPWEAFNQINPEGFERDHPGFGPLNYAQWKRIIGKHNLHHFTQFDLV